MRIGFGLKEIQIGGFISKQIKNRNYRQIAEWRRRLGWDHHRAGFSTEICILTLSSIFQVGLGRSRLCSQSLCPGPQGIFAVFIQLNFFSSKTPQIIFSCTHTEKKIPKTKPKKQILEVGFNANICMQLFPSSSSSANAKISWEQIIFELEIAMISIKKPSDFVQKVQTSKLLPPSMVNIEYRKIEYHFGQVLLHCTCVWESPNRFRS